MHHSIEEILQSHSIHEIRQLIQELAVDANGKQGELQQMVGSTYHDFIQSADAIASMKNKSSTMNQQLLTFGQSVEEIVKQTKDLLAKSNLIQSKSKLHLGSRNNDMVADQTLSCSWDISELDSANIWMCLDNCNIFRACQILALTESIVTFQQDIPIPVPNNCYLTEVLRLKCTELVPRNSTSHQLLARCSSTRYLRQTIIDDSFLLFLHGQCSIHEIAMTMAGLAGLEMCSKALKVSTEFPENLSGKSLLQKYLDGVETKLHSHLKRLNNSSLFDGRDANPISSLSSILISLVEILQKTLLEVFVIFLQPIESHASPSAELHPLPGGLFGYHLRQFIQSLVPANSSVSWSSIDGMIQENVAPLLFLEVWFPWIRTQIEHIQTSCKAAFSRINSPADVSKLQRLVSQSCLSKSLIHEVYQKNVTSTGHFDKAEGKRNESDLEALDAVWSTSCSCLLENILTARWNQFQFQFQPRSLHPSAPNGQVTEGGKLVWIYIFRQPFLSLVERLMKISCRDIFHTVKHSVIGILSSLSSVSHRTTSGSQKVRLLIDTLTFDMKYQTVEKPKASKPVSVGGVSDAWEDEVSCFASSTELFLHAEKVRLYLENQMMTLMNELLFTGDGEPSSNPDPDASYSLLRSLQIQSGELIGQILLLIRVLLSRYQSGFEKLQPSHQQSSQPRKSSFLSSFEPHPHIPPRIQQNLLLNGVLFLVRFVWLLRSSSGDFLSRVLNSSTVHLKSLSRHHHYQYMTTIEQIISAFDIADTDGDGCLNWNEAREAVEALWIDPSSILTGKAGQPEDEMTESTGPVNFDFLWYDSTTLQSPDHLGLVFTLDEFRLVCSQMIAPPSHTSPASIEIPTVCLKRSLESLLSSAFVTLKTEIVGYLGRSYQSALVDLFPVHSFSAESSLTETFISNPPFRAKWKQRLAALESDSEAGDLTEKVTIPCHPTIAVSSLLRYTATFLHRTSLSIDTVHKTDGSILIPQHFHITSTDQLVTVSSLWDYTRSIFYASCRQMIEEELNSQHQLLTRLANSSAKFQQVFEDYSLQLLFDMQILHSCFSTNPSGVPSSSSPVSPMGSFPCYDLYYNSIDPVNIAFLEPFLVEECQGYLSKYHLLLPGADQRTVLNQQLLENVGKSLSGLSSGQVKGKHDARSEELLTSIFMTTGEPSSVTKKGNSESSTRFPLLPLPISLTSTGQRAKTVEGKVRGSGASLDLKSQEPKPDEKRDSFSTPTRGLSSVFKGFKGW